MTPSQLRIGIIAPPWVAVPPRGYGGTEAVLDELARGLCAAGHDVRLFTTGDSTCPVHRHWVYEQAYNGRIGSSSIELRHVIRGYEWLGDVDIVHDHTLIGPMLAAWWPDLPVATTNHGPFDDELTDVYRTVATRVPVIAISHHQASTANGVAIADVIHHGIDVDRYPCGTGDGGYLLFLGRMIAAKGVDIAARAARRAGRRLVIAAKMREPREREYFEQRVQPLLGSGVQYVGEVGSAQKLDLLAGAEALVNPIVWPEPFGMVMLEALACGTPVVGFGNGAAPEIVDHQVTGYLCGSEDELVLRLGELDTLSRYACRRTAQTRFSTDRMVRRHVDLYRRIVDARGGGRLITSSPGASEAALVQVPAAHRRQARDLALTGTGD